MEGLSNLLDCLHRGQVEHVLVGGLAAILHGCSQVTQDIDVCCRFSTENLQRLDRALSGLHPVHRLTPQKLPLELRPEICADLKNLYLQTDLGPLDCLGEVLGVGSFDVVWKQSIVVVLPFGECRVLNLEALIRAKEAMHRPHDLVAVRQLKAIQERLRS